MNYKVKFVIIDITSHLSIVNTLTFCKNNSYKMSTLTQINQLLMEKSEYTRIVSQIQIDNARIYIQSRLKEIDIQLEKFNSNYVNYVNLMNFLFDNEISEIKNSSLTLYKPKIALTYAPPQVGKTNAIIEIVKDCVMKNISVVISSDNKKDQMCQLFSRLIKALQDQYENIFEYCFITTIDNKNFDTLVDEMRTHKSFVICCLDNKSQIQKVHEKINAIHEINSMSNLCLIHDEADVITKARNITEVMASQPESHKKWIELTDNLYNKGISMKRVFVTATPENVVYLHKPGYVWELPIPHNYVSYKDFEFTELNSFDTHNITRILSREVKRRKDEGGIILYCVERNKDETNEEDDRSNQTQVFVSCMNNLKKTGLDVVSSYNSNGFKLAFRLQKHKTLFVNKMEERNIQYSTSEDGSFTIKKNELAICEFYGYLQQCDCKVILTIGKDLISRGISFVSNYLDNPLTATTMIYKPGQQLSQVALTQAIGRLNGTAQPSLKRRLYTTDDVYSNYTTFMRNQKEIMSAIKSNGNKVDTDLIGEIALWKSSRSVDRKTLKLEQDMVFWEETESDTEDDGGYVSDEHQIDGVKLAKLNQWIHSETLVGRMINYLYTQDKPISIEEFKNDVDYTESTNKFISNIANGCGSKTRNGKLWCYKNDTVELNSNIRAYIDSL